jgi:DNA-binding NtrC family response regulator
MSKDLTSAATRVHILIVDDELVIRELLESFLAMAGYRVTAVPSAFEAEAVAVRDRPALVITDLQLEESDGLEMVSRLKTLLPETPMILLTGVLFDPKVVREVLHKKVSSYIEKTAPLSRILEEVRRLTAGT